MDCPNRCVDETYEYQEWIGIFFIAVTVALQGKLHLLFAESRMLRKISCSQRLGRTIRESIGNCRIFPEAFALLSKGKYTAHGRLLSPIVVILLIVMDIALIDLEIEASDVLMALRVLLYAQALLTFGTASAMNTKARRFIFVIVPICTLLYGAFNYYLLKYDPFSGRRDQQTFAKIVLVLRIFRYVVAVGGMTAVFLSIFWTLRKQELDIASYASARIGGKSFRELRSRQKDRYLKLRAGDKESVVENEGVFGLFQLVCFAIISVTNPIAWGSEPNPKLLVTFVTLESMEVAFVLLLTYNNSTVESKLFTVLAQCTADESLSETREEVSAASTDGKRFLEV